MATDTSAEAIAVQVAVMRRLGPEGRLRVAVEMSEVTRQMTIEGMCRRQPGLTEADARKQYVLRLIEASRAR
jgi:hypothetical protein